MSADPAPPRPLPPAADLLTRALVTLLRPLVRLCIQAGLTFPALTDLLRNLYVEVALHDVLLDPHSRTDSRVSLVTGVHRKEVRRHREQPQALETASLSLSTRVIARWLASPALTDPDGRPLPLRRAGPPPSLDALVANVTTDVRPRALLDEWLDAGVATLDADGMVRLEQAAFVPRGDRDQQMFFFARNLRDHLAAAAANVAARGEPPFLDRAAHYDGLSADAAAQIEAAAREAAQTALLQLNREALAIADIDDRAATPDGPPRQHRVNLGIYVFAEQASQEPLQPATPRGADAA